MKKAFLSLILIASVALSGCSSTSSETKNTTPSNDSKSNQNVANYLRLNRLGYSPEHFKDPTTCLLCHREIYEQWEGSMHSLAWVDPVYQKKTQKGIHATDGAIENFCAACHSPIAVMANEVDHFDDSKMSIISKRGISCDFCHTVKASTGIGDSAFINDPGNIKRGPFKDSVSPVHQTEFSELHTKAEFCGMCHNVNHPFNGTHLEATYTEWKNSPYAEQGIVCQDCHMTPGPGVTKPNPGKAATEGPDREHIWTHNFVGANVAIPTLMGYPEQAKLAEERLQSAASLALELPQFLSKGNNKLTVKVTNVGAGHYLPTGLTEAREMWLELSLIDSNGHKLYHSGYLDEKGNLEPNAVRYITIFGDSNGKPTDKVWEASTILSDKRIPPKKSSLEIFTFDLRNASGPVTVKASLKYRSAPQYLMDYLFGEGQMQLPIITMVETSAEVPVK